MKIRKNYNEKDLLRSIEGHINTITSHELDKEINDEIGNFESLPLDFTDLEYTSSAGLRVLIGTAKKLKNDNIPPIIKNVNDAVGKIFRISNFDRILKIE